MTSTRAPAARPARTRTGQPAGPGGRLGRWRGSPPLTLLAVAMGVMMVGLDGTIVAVANPAIQSHLHASLAGIQWISNAYLLALAVSLIAAGKAGDRFGHKKVFTIGVAGFAASSAAIGLSGSIAGSITLVIAFRALQGVFGAMLQPTALALLRKNFPAEKLNAAIGIWGAVIGASTAAGPIVGGLLVQHIGWEACFYINVPVGLIALAASLLVLRETDPSPAARSFDIPGIATLSGALFLLIWGLIKGPDYGWSSAATLAFLGAAALAGLLFVLRQGRATQPLLPLRLFRSASLSAGVVLVILLMFAMFGAMFFMTFYLENVHGLDPVGAGVHLLPMTAMLIVGSPLAGALISKLGRRHQRHRRQRPSRAGRRGRRPAVHRHAGRRRPRHRRPRRGDVRQDQRHAAGQLARRAPTPAQRRPAGRREERGLGRPSTHNQSHAAPARQPDHPHQPRHVHRRDAQRLPGRRRGCPGRSRHRADHQARHRHRRSPRRHLTGPPPHPRGNPMKSQLTSTAQLPAR